MKEEIDNELIFKIKITGKGWYKGHELECTDKGWRASFRGCYYIYSDELEELLDSLSWCEEHYE